MIDLKKLKDGLLAKGDCFMFGVSLFDLIELTERQEVELAAARARITALESAIRKQLNPAWECNSDHPALAAAVRDSAPAVAEQVDALSDEQIANEFDAAGVRLQYLAHSRKWLTKGSVELDQLIAAVRAILAAQKGAAPDEEEIKRLHRELAGERMRANEGWARYESANADRNALRAERVAAPMQTPGVDWPGNSEGALTHLAKLAAKVVGDVEAAHCASLVQPAAPVQPGTLTQAQIDHIGEQWDGCMYDAPGEMIDIGHSIRAELAKVAAPVQAAPEGEPKHPMQPVVLDGVGTLRFKENAIIRFLAHGRLNELACMGFSDADREQLVQLIGYSVGGTANFEFLSDETYNAAQAAGELLLAAAPAPRGSV